jgi:DNA invertase Pin-like site-specific DNA recombinase
VTTGRTQIATTSAPSADGGEPAPEPVRAFIYDRHATQSTAVLEERLERCRAYAQAQGWEVAGVWCDLGDNALGIRRPQFDALLVAMDKARGPVVCLVDNWDRLTRDASASSVMRRRVSLRGGHCETAEGESDTADEMARGRLSAPH